MSKKEFPQNSLEICISLSKKPKYFVFHDKKYPFDYELIKSNSSFFFRYQNQYDNIDFINLFQDNEIEQFNDMKETAITSFISLCQNKECKINKSDIFYIQYLAKKYEVSELLNIITSIISANHKELVFDMFSFQYKNLYQENETFDTFEEKDAEIIALKLIEYIKDDRIFNFPIPALYQILSQFFKRNNNLSDEEEKSFSDFLFKCLDKNKSEASILFTFIDFNKNEVIERLSTHYLNVQPFRK